MSIQPVNEVSQESYLTGGSVTMGNSPTFTTNLLGRTFFNDVTPIDQLNVAAHPTYQPQIVLAYDPSKQENWVGATGILGSRLKNTGPVGSEAVPRWSYGDVCPSGLTGSAFFNMTNSFTDPSLQTGNVTSTSPLSGAKLIYPASHPFAGTEIYQVNSSSTFNTSVAGTYASVGIILELGIQSAYSSIIYDYDPDYCIAPATGGTTGCGLTERAQGPYIQLRRWHVEAVHIYEKNPYTDRYEHVEGNIITALYGDSAGGGENLLYLKWTVQNAGRTLIYLVLHRTPYIDPVTSIVQTPSHLSRPFITTWNVDTSIKLPIDQTVGLYNFDVDWGDGSLQRVTNSSTFPITHAYAKPGRYTVSIFGTCSWWIFVGAYQTSKNNIVEVNQWGDDFRTSNVNTGQATFRDCPNVDIKAQDHLNFEGVVGGDPMAFMFLSCSSLTGRYTNFDWPNVPANQSYTWCFRLAPNFNAEVPASFVYKPSRLDGMFTFCSSFNNGGKNTVSDWDMSGCTSIDGVFAYCINFNQDVVWGGPGKTFRPTFVTGDYPAFLNATNFNGKGIDTWDMTNCVSRGGMLAGCANFNQNVGATFCTSTFTNITNGMGSVFNGCTKFDNGGDNSIQLWDVSNLTDISGLFNGCRDFKRDLSMWNITNNLTNMIGTFWGCGADFSINSWDFSNVVHMQWTFRAGGFNNGNVPADSWDLSSCTNVKGMFAGNENFRVSVAWGSNFQPVDQYEVDFNEGMFKGCILFNAPGVETWDLSLLVNRQSMFRDCTTYNQYLGANFIDSSVTNTVQMFDSCIAFNHGGLTGINSWDFSNVIGTYRTFYRCKKFNNAGQTPLVIDLSSSVFNRAMFYETAIQGQVDITFNTTSTYSNEELFYNSTGFNSDMSAWDVRNCTNMYNAFNNTALSQANFEASVIGWAALPTLQNGVYVGLTGISPTITQPSGPGAYQTAYNILTGTYGWVFQGIA